MGVGAGGCLFSFRSPCVHRAFMCGSGGCHLGRLGCAAARGQVAAGQRSWRAACRGWDAMTEVRSGDLIAALDEASLSRFHLRAVVVSGMGFFTDAYDLFVIGIASPLIAKQWHLSSDKLALLNSVMLAAAFLGALVFGRFADVAG